MKAEAEQLWMQKSIESQPEQFILNVWNTLQGLEHNSEMNIPGNRNGEMSFMTEQLNNNLHLQKSETESHVVSAVILDTCSTS